ncbi:MAG: LEPR-XLL domain-containing protein, partial [Chloroflexi bacterium]|nr:LEPR-XLL domain-containing protein [Chloroflexota bacterium]
MNLAQSFYAAQMRRLRPSFTRARRLARQPRPVRFEHLEPRLLLSGDTPLLPALIDASAVLTDEVVPPPAVQAQGERPYFADARIADLVDRDADGWAQRFDLEFRIQRPGSYSALVFEDDGSAADDDFIAALPFDVDEEDILGGDYECLSIVPDPDMQFSMDQDADVDIDAGLAGAQNRAE